MSRDIYDDQDGYRFLADIAYQLERIADTFEKVAAVVSGVDVVAEEVAE